MDRPASSPNRSILRAEASLRCRLERSCRLCRCDRFYALRQRPKTRPPTVNPRPNVPTAKVPDRERLARRREPLPVADRLLLLGRQRLAAALLAQRAAGPQPEVEVVEDLGGFIRHRTQCIACFGVARAAPPPLRSARWKPRTGRDRRQSQVARGADSAAADRRHRRPHTPRPAARARAGRGLPAPARRAAARGPGQPRHPVHVPRPLHPAVGRVRAPVGDRRAGSPLRGAARRRPELGPSLAAPVGRAAGEPARSGRRGCSPRLPRARSGSWLCTTT